MEVKRTNTDRIRAIYESMTKNRAALEFSSATVRRSYTILTDRESQLGSSGLHSN
jgi:hypothetical protein